MSRARIPQLIVAQLILAAVGSYEFRSLFVSLAHAIRLISSAQSSVPIWLAAGVAMVLGFGLLQIGRGLNRVARPPRWTLQLLGVWLMLATVLVVLYSAVAALAGHGVPAHALTPDGLGADVPAGLALALVLAVALHGGGWVARRALTVRVCSSAAAARDPVGRRSAPEERQTAPEPLLIGWSGRGPPSYLSPQAI